MPKRSAGLLMYRRGTERDVEVFLVHPGGPMWAKKNEGAWTLPKGEYGPDEDALSAARREFQEETGFTATGEFLELGSVRQKSGKIVAAWAFEAEIAILTTVGKQYLRDRMAATVREASCHTGSG